MSKYDLFIQEKDSGQKYCQKFILWPDKWNKFTRNDDLHWQSVRATKDAIKRLPDMTGVYVFTVAPLVAGMPFPGYIVYVGKAQDQSLRTRCRVYFWASEYEKRPYIGDMIRLWSGHLRLWFATCDSTIVSEIEDALLTAWLPPFNRDFEVDINRAAEAIYRS